MSYGTIAGVRQFARGILEDKVDDTTIQAFLDATSGILEQYAQRTWTKTVGEIEYHDGDTFDTLRLENYPVVAVTSIEKRESTGWTLLDVWDDATGEGDYVLNKAAAGILEWTSEKHPSDGTRIVRATYDHGFDSVPVYVTAIVEMMAAIMALSNAAGVTSADGLVSISEGSLSLSWGSGPYMDTIGLLERQVNALLLKVVRQTLIAVPSRVPR